MTIKVWNGKGETIYSDDWKVNIDHVMLWEIEQERLELLRQLRGYRRVLDMMTNRKSIDLSMPLRGFRLILKGRIATMSKSVGDSIGRKYVYDEDYDDGYRFDSYGYNKVWRHSSTLLEMKVHRILRDAYVHPSKMKPTDEDNQERTVFPWITQRRKGKR